MVGGFGPGRRGKGALGCLHVERFSYPCRVFGNCRLPRVGRLRTAAASPATRRDAGIALVAAGAGIAIAGGIMFGASGSSYNVATTDGAAELTETQQINIMVTHAAGASGLIVGGTLALVGLPITLINATRMGRVKKWSATAGRPLPRLDVGGAGLALRF